MDRPPYEPDVSWSDSTGWAWARNSPFRYYKQNQYEGGVATPAIAHWPAGLRRAPGTLIHSPAHLVDVLPTVADITGAPVPESHPGRGLTPLAGVSLLPILTGAEVTERPPIHFLFATDRALRDGDWKLVSFRGQPWELYNMADDRTELHDVAAQYPERLATMSRQWHQMATEVLRAPERECRPVATKAGSHQHPEWSVYSGENGSVTSSRSLNSTRRPGSRPRPES
jgi:arylsulfatase